jgi:hypothetical protein
MLLVFVLVVRYIIACGEIVYPGVSREVLLNTLFML